MHFKKHFVNRKLHIIFHFHCCQQHVISLVRQIIGGSPDSILQIHDLIINIADIDVLIGPFFIIKGLKIHGRTAVPKDIFHHKSCKFLTFLKV